MPCHTLSATHTVRPNYGTFLEPPPTPMVRRTTRAGRSAAGRHPPPAEPSPKGGRPRAVTALPPWPDPGVGGRLTPRPASPAASVVTIAPPPADGADGAEDAERPAGCLGGLGYWIKAWFR